MKIVIAEGVVTEMDYGRGNKDYYISGEESVTYPEDIKKAINRYIGQKIKIKIEVIK